MKAYFCMKNRMPCLPLIQKDKNATIGFIFNSNDNGSIILLLNKIFVFIVSMIYSFFELL